MLEKACTMKRLEYYPLDKELKAQTDIAKKQHQKLSNTLGFNKVINKENYSKSNVTYDANHSFCKYSRDSEKFDNLSFKSNYSFLETVFDNLNKFNKLNLHKNCKRGKNKCL